MNKLLVTILLVPVVAASSTPVDVPFESLGGRPVVEATVNGSPARLLLDTGASGCTIAPSLAGPLKLPEIGKALMKSPMGSAPVEASLVRIDAFAIGTFAAKDVECAVWESGLPGINIIGLPPMTGNLVTVDYPAGRIRIESGALPAADGRAIFEYPATERLPMVDATIGGQQVKLHIDSGSPGAVTFPSAMAGQLKLESAPVEVGRAHSVDAEFAVLEAVLAGDVQIGATTLSHPTVRFAGARAMGELGAMFLKDYVVTVDPANHRVRLERSGKSEIAKKSEGPTKVGATSPVDAHLSALTGVYGQRTIAIQDGALSLQRAGGPPLRLISQGNDEFRIEGLPASARVRFVRHADGVLDLHVMNPQGKWEIAPKNP